MQPTSEAQYTAAQTGGLPPLESVRDGVWALGVDLPNEHVPYTLSYLVRDSGGGIHLIDPGMDSDENWQSLLAALAEIGHAPDDVASVVVTHLHHDHLGMAERIRRATAAPVALHRLDQLALDAGERNVPPPLAAWQVPDDRRAELEASAAAAAAQSAGPPFTADQRLEHDDILNVPGRSLRVLWTPGHTNGHICLVDDAARLVFTGDHVLPTIYPGVGLGGPTEGNPLADYLDSLAALGGAGDDIRSSASVRDIRDYEALPGHGYRFSGLGERVDDILSHHRRRTDEVAAALETLANPSVWSIAASLTWSAGWVNLSGFMLRSALAQTAMHVDLVSQRSAV
ncbi:MBL fold metallo-hydrolase [Salinibacterium sp. ZJ450]|uniref:MBL fold metallo-hydrolase n=1 Tax=Salinibacterium sp. ZJ450 TaxID=2708338 RepID=UPI001420068D|nr:MBL fold metallo-hydrolase [Salinibacterium sp. ZJ450]